ncbi:MAG: hypothetical protein HYY37_06175 [Candidatus Aenigmarchaeota archaeon]|nr:hypothetical protein [Candidatus Aenigmarchaeota archaeon]
MTDNSTDPIKTFDVKIKSSDKDVIAHGTFITFDSNENAITLKKDEKELTFIIAFKDDADKLPMRVEDEILDPKNKMRLNFINFNFIESGSTKPVNMGVFDGRELFAQFRIKRMNNSIMSRTVEYTFYLGNVV